MTYTRRKLLATSGIVTGAIGIAGCFSTSNGLGSDAKFRLKSFSLPNITEEFIADPLTIDSKYEIDYSNEYKRSRVTRLFETGTVSTRAWELSYLKDWGPTVRDKRRVMIDDGTYYRIQIDDLREVDRKRWSFYFDWDVEEPSDNETVVSPPLESFSEQDREIVTAAKEAIPIPDQRGAFNDHSVIFHDNIDADASDLVPSPPFEYYYDDEYLQAFVERKSIRKTEMTYSATPVAETESEYRKYAHETFPDVRFSNVSLSSDAGDILDEATASTSGFSYEERPPLSDELKEVLEHLTIAQHLKPHDEYENFTEFSNALAKYDGQWQGFDLLIYP